MLCHAVNSCLYSTNRLIPITHESIFLFKVFHIVPVFLRICYLENVYDFFAIEGLSLSISYRLIIFGENWNFLTKFCPIFFKKIKIAFSPSFRSLPLGHSSLCPLRPIIELLLTDQNPNPNSSRKTNGSSSPKKSAMSPSLWCRIIITWGRVFRQKPPDQPGSGFCLVLIEFLCNFFPAFVKRPLECWISGGSYGREPIQRQASTSLARASTTVNFNLANVVF